MKDNENDCSSMQSIIFRRKHRNRCVIVGETPNLKRTNQNITADPSSIIASDFVVKGKIVSR